MSINTNIEPLSSATLEYPGSLAQIWAPSWLSTSPKTPETPAVVEEIEPKESATDFPAVADPNGCTDAENEFCWSQLNDRDLVYLTAPRESPDPCPWCGGRTRHNPACDELRGSWEVVMPFGKWKGKPLSEVPDDYLHWLRNKLDLDPELRDAIQARLGASA